MADEEVSLSQTSAASDGSRCSMDSVALQSGLDRFMMPPPPSHVIDVDPYQDPQLESDEVCQQVLGSSDEHFPDTQLASEAEDGVPHADDGSSDVPPSQPRSPGSSASEMPSESECEANCQVEESAVKSYAKSRNLDIASVSLADVRASAPRYEVPLTWNRPTERQTDGIPTNRELHRGGLTDKQIDKPT